jgi:predicted TIM-barrel fold metal-dependent hydrolase
VGWDVFQIRDAHDLVERVYEAFGAKRLMWAIDWPVCLKGANCV